MGSLLDISPHPLWVDSLHAYVEPYRDQILESDWVKGVSSSTLTVPEMQGWMLQLYPFIHTFPKFLAEALTKVEDDYSRGFLIDNIRVEKAHAEHWIWMGEGFGVPRSAMLDIVEGRTPLLRDVQSLTDWLWYINTKGSLAEAVAATSFAVEGVTGDLSRKVINGFEAYGKRDDVDMKPKTYKWMREHVHYDDEHPIIALEIVKRYATTERLQTKVMIAAKRSVQLLHNALATSYEAYSTRSNDSDSGPTVIGEQRANDRRADRRLISAAIPFPERRFGERRGRRCQVAA